MSTATYEMTTPPTPFGTRTVSRRLLRHEIRRELLNALLSGSLPGGKYVTEKTLAAELGVSRTPLREALFGLEQDGFFQSRNGKGLIVTPLNVREVGEVFPILATLEALALRSSGELSEEDSTRLFARSAEPDPEWSRLLFSECGNDELSKEILRHQDRALRYELAYFRASGTPPWNPAERRRVVETMGRGEYDVAASLVETLRLDTARRLVRWLSE